MFIVKCPKCGKPSKAFVDHAGLRGKCPHCRKKIPIVADSEDSPAAGLLDIHPLPRSARRSGPGRAKLPDTSPPAFVLGIAGAALTWAFYHYAPGQTRFADAWAILRSCDWIGQVELFLFAWGSLMVMWKALLWNVQRRSLRWNVLPEPADGQPGIASSDVERRLDHLASLARQPRRSILLNRVILSLEHLRQTRNVSEVRGALTGQSAIDANLLDSSYTIIRFLVWVIPIVGFIGTVIGIGFAVSQFAGFLPQVTEVEKAMESLRAGLGQVTKGLGTAFNTTLVALILVAPLMLAASWLRKLEERLLAEIDQFSNHQLLAALADSSREGALP